MWSKVLSSFACKYLRGIKGVKVYALKFENNIIIIWVSKDFKGICIQILCFKDSRVRTVTIDPKIFAAFFFIWLLYKWIFHFQNISKNQGSFYKMDYDFWGTVLEQEKSYKAEYNETNLHICGIFAM